jgi:hypothetical protein
MNDLFELDAEKMALKAQVSELRVRLQELEEIAELARELMPPHPRPGSKTERLCQLLSTPEEG